MLELRRLFLFSTAKEKKDVEYLFIRCLLVRVVLFSYDRWNEKFQKNRLLEITRCKWTMRCLVSILQPLYTKGLFISLDPSFKYL